MEDRKSVPRRGGVFDSILILFAFSVIASVVRAPFHGAAFYIVDSILRAATGVMALSLFVKRFQKGKWTNVIHSRHFKAGLCAGIGLLLLTLFLILQIVTGARSFGITPQMAFAEVFLQQLMTGFWEEMVFRAYLMEAYYSALSAEERTWKKRLYYSLLSAVIFAALHTIGGGSSLPGLVIIGVIGFIFAAAYLYSHNILSCMFLHFVYDVFIHLQGDVAEWDQTNWLVRWNDPIFLTIMGVGLLVAIIYLIKEPVDEGEEQQDPPGAVEP